MKKFSDIYPIEVNGVCKGMPAVSGGHLLEPGSISVNYSQLMVHLHSCQVIMRAI